MSNRGPDRKATPEQILQLMEDSDRPVWTASSIAEELGVTRPPVRDRLEDVVEDHRVKTMKVGNTEAYYLSDEDPRPIEERHKDSLIKEFTDKFVGLPTAPWTAVHPNDGPAEAGDKIQLRVEGVPGRWRQQMAQTWEDRREELIYEETDEGETQALISGELYAKPTTPIEHTDYPDDYDLELNIGAEVMENDGNSAIIAAGVKNYLIRPCNDAVFLENVSVDWMSPKGHGQELTTAALGVSEAEESGPGFVEQMLDANPHGEVGKGWLKNMLALGAVGLDEESVELLVTHSNSPIDSEEELRELAEEAADTTDSDAPGL
ncbi:winged helix-turn-helix domain-containing protein [Natronoarchaeum rubrum]|uniref:winged helix-turn-helix domain-containing protein n=1 Tax=Natronoarchaeum rubrum TaxID=755311 RepID=UPI002111C84D|nr:winged helix-turn-helix domain-containing protein [Natronoarchaeum rubrum]